VNPAGSAAVSQQLAVPHPRRLSLPKQNQSKPSQQKSFQKNPHEESGAP